MAGNGNLDPSALGYVSGHRVRADLVAQTVAMVAAAARDGVTLRITQAYRPLADQVAIFRARYTPRTTGDGPYGDVRWWAGVRYVRTSGAAAAVPGTSNHGWGQAIDFATDSPGAIAWLSRNGARFGWTRPAWTFKAPTIEPWHWEATYVFVSNPIGGGTGTVPTVPNLPPLTPIEEIDMPSIEEVTDAVGERVKAILRSDEFGRNRALAIAGESAAAVWEYPVTGVDPTKALMAAEVLRDARVAKELHEKVAALGVSVAGIASPTIDPAALAAALAPLVSVGLTEVQVTEAVKAAFANVRLVVS